MSKKPLVSVRIPSYNHADYIADCINSILNQTYQDFEIVIVDDASSDNSVEIIKSFNDPRIILEVLPHNSGMNTAVERCIQLSNGKYIANISSDDTWEPSKLEKQVSFLEENKDYDAVFTRVNFIGEEGTLLDNSNYKHSTIFDCDNREPFEWLRKFFYDGNCLCNPSVLIRKSVYKSLGLQDKRLISLSDLNLWMKFSFHHKLWILDDKLTNFRIRNNEMNLSADNEKNRSRMVFEYKQILDNYLSIDNVEYFLKIFPECLQYGQPTIDTIPYFLGRLAIDSHWVFRKLWGCEKIYALLSNEKMANHIKENLNFSYVDFYKISKMNNFNCLLQDGKYIEINHNKNIIDNIKTFDLFIIILKRIKNRLLNIIR